MPLLFTVTATALGRFDPGVIEGVYDRGDTSVDRDLSAPDYAIFNLAPFTHTASYLLIYAHTALFKNPAAVAFASYMTIGSPL